MSVKRFVAPDMRRALDLVRQEMGPNAIILSSQKTNGGVEVVTSSETDMPTRGVDEREAFSNNFDGELDQPLASDQAWHLHSSVKKAAEDHGAYKFSQDVEASAERLAKEIDAARDRMLEAKRAAMDSSELESNLSTLEASIPPPKSNPQSSTRGRGAKAAPAARPRQSTPASSQAKTQTNADVPPEYDHQIKGLQAQIDEMKKSHRKQLESERKKAEEQRISHLQDDIADMRLLLEQQLRTAREQQKEVGKKQSTMTESPKVHAIKSPSIHAETVASNLASMGLPAAVVHRLTCEVKAGKTLNTVWRESLAELAQLLPVDDLDCIGKGGTFAFVGPTGVGKTTTIAKLAARYVLENGPGKVALVTTDTYRVGAHDQLRSLGRILNVPVRVIDNETNLSAVLDNLKSYPLILIDTAGFRHGDPLLKQQDRVLDSCHSIQRIVVLPCNSQYQTLKASLHAYRGERSRGCILTKVDETASLGEALGVVIQQDIPLLYTTNGQAVPKDLDVASSYKLVTEAVKIFKQQSALQDEFADGGGQ